MTWARSCAYWMLWLDDGPSERKRVAALLGVPLERLTGCGRERPRPQKNADEERLLATRLLRGDS